MTAFRSSLDSRVNQIKAGASNIERLHEMVRDALCDPLTSYEHMAALTQQYACALLQQKSLLASVSDAGGIEALVGQASLFDASPARPR